MNWIKSKLAKLPKNALIVIGLVAVVLVAVSEWHPLQKTADNEDKTARYAAELEKRLLVILQSMDGVGRCKIMVTLENGVESVYANEQSTEINRVDGDGKTTVRDDTQRKVVVVGSGSGRDGLLVTEIQPTVRGVAVICEGGGNQSVRKRVAETVATVLHITESRVSISQ